MVIDWTFIDEYDITDSFGLFYDVDKNCFIDEDGFVVWSIFDIISPNDLMMFRDRADDMIVNHRTLPGVLVELYFPKED